jgi:hypothetical protein
LARIGPLLILAAALSGCGLVGAEITVDARNDSNGGMRIQVVEGIGPDAVQPFGPPHILDPFEERTLELAVPGGDWTVTVNEQPVIDSSEVGIRRGRLPVTLIVPAPDDPIDQPYWEAPADSAGGG